MPELRTSRSFELTDARTVSLPDGSRVHQEHLAQNERLRPRIESPRPGVWCVLGNGLSNQTFVEGPEGIIAIDSGESNEEMAASIAQLRTQTDRPIVAVLYTHFHYVSGTAAIFQESGGNLPIWGHAKIDGNLARASTEIGPTYSRGVVEQFAIALPSDGPDHAQNVGLGLYWRRPDLGRPTPGYLPPTNTFDTDTTLEVAGLTIEVTLAPSDADDSVTYFFKELGLAVHNLVWPLLFNIFAIRGEEYRDPNMLIRGIDHLLSLQPEHLVATHGPSMSGREEIQQRVTRYRDSLAYIWDQTVRLTNLGATTNDLAHQVQLPALYSEDYLTTELYGVVEHHARQIRSGLFGFFDGDPANLFPVPTAERSSKLIAGFGGADVIRAAVSTAYDTNDLRWGIELASWLSTSPLATNADHQLLATGLRLIAERTTAANIRSWCLTRARVLEGQLDTSWLAVHALRPKAILEAPLERNVHLLRVLLDPKRAEGQDLRITWNFGDECTGLHLRNCVAAPTTGENPDITLSGEKASWAAVLGGEVNLSTALERGDVMVEGDPARLIKALSAFDIPSLRS